MKKLGMAVAAYFSCHGRLELINNYWGRALAVCDVFVMCC
jgi:hypothetical protein